MLWTTLISVCLVFCILVLLVWIMKLFGAIFICRRKAAAATAETGTVIEQGQLHEEEIAAIATALKIFNKRPARPRVGCTDDHEHQARLLALELENSWFNPDA